MAQSNGSPTIELGSIKVYNSVVPLEKVITRDKSVAQSSMIDISNLVEEITLRESVTSNFVTGMLLMNDSINVLENLPLIGGEIVHMKYNSMGDDNKIDLYMRVAKVSNVVMEQKKATYIVHLISEYGYQNYFNRISKSFSGNAIEIASKIFTDHMVLKDYERDLYVPSIDTVAGSMKFVTPQWSPAQAINWIASKGISVVNGRRQDANLMFFETINAGFNLLSADMLFNPETNKPITDKLAEIRGDRPDVQGKGLHLNVANIPVKTNGNTGDVVHPIAPKQNLQSIHDFTFDDRNDIINDLRNGLLGAETITHDIFSKQIVTNKHNYLDDYYQYTHAGQHPKYANPELANTSGRLFVSPKQSGNFDASRNVYSDSYFMSRRIFSQRLSDIQISNLQVGGHTIYAPGRLVQVNVPYYGKTEATRDYDKYYSGYYFIKDIQHTFSPTVQDQWSHQVNMNVVKDGIEKY
jgi:hypothetical protein